MKKFVIALAFLVLISPLSAHDNDGRCIHSGTVAYTTPSIIEYKPDRISFYLTINNTDKYCYSRGYDIKIDKPQGWGAFAQGSIVISPQQYSTITVALTPPANLADGVYEIPIRVIHYEGGVNTTARVVKGISSIEETPKDDLVNQNPSTDLPQNNSNDTISDESNELQTGFWAKIKSFFKNLFS